MKCMSKNRQVADTPYSGKKQRKHLVKKGETIVVTAGDPATNVTKAEGVVTNMLQVLEVY